MPITVRGEAWGNLYLTDKADGEFTAADEEAAVILAAWAAIGIDNARLYRSLEARRDELERAVRGLEATTAIARAVGGETDIDRVLELIVKRARALVEARALVILLEEGGELIVAATAGDIGVETVGMQIPLEGTVAGQVFRTGTPVRLSADVASRLRASLRDELEASTELAVPLQFRGRAWGVLAAFDRLGPHPEFDAEDERLMQSFAASAATAVATAKVVAEDRLRHSIRSTEAERGRWARELHDETLQSLAALRVLLSTALRQGNPEALEGAAREAVEQIAGEITSLRALITELRPAALDELGLEPAIESLVDRFRSTQGVDVTHTVVAARAPARRARGDDLSDRPGGADQHRQARARGICGGPHRTRGGRRRGRDLRRRPRASTPPRRRPASGSSACASGPRCWAGSWRSPPSRARAHGARRPAGARHRRGAHARASRAARASAPASSASRLTSPWSSA